MIEESLEKCFQAPHTARIWNYWMGGKDNYELDREVGDAVAKDYPAIVTLARESRQFLIRVVRFLAAEAGVRQFLDIGTGLPTVQNTHEVAQRVAPESRTVYVDNDPVVLAHARALLASTSPAGVVAYLDADMRDPLSIIDGAREVLNFNRPVAVIFMGVLGHIGDDRQARVIVSRIMAAVPRGSYLVINDGADTSDGVRAAAVRYSDSGAIPYYLRSPERIGALFEGLDLVPPGLVSGPLWRPDDPEAARPIDQFGAVGRKR